MSANYNYLTPEEEEYIRKCIASSEKGLIQAKTDVANARHQLQQAENTLSIHTSHINRYSDMLQGYEDPELLKEVKEELKKASNELDKWVQHYGKKALVDYVNKNT